MIQNKTIHYWKLGRDELLLARRNPEIQEIKDHQKEQTWRGCRQDGATLFVQISTTLTTTNIYYFYFINLTNGQINNI